jgi:phage baseplate assembly protein gpV
MDMDKHIELPFETGEVKAVICKDGKMTQHTVMIVQVDADQSQALSQAGYAGYTQWYAILGGGRVEFHYDAHKLRIEGTAIEGNVCTKKLVLGLHHGGIDFDDVPNDQTFYPEDVEDLKNVGEE